MQIKDEEFYRIMYSMRSALCTVYGLAEQAVRETEEDKKNKALGKIKEQITEFVDSIEKINPSDGIEAVHDMKKFKMKNTRALVIDDNDISNYIIRQMLEQFDIVVDVAMSGEEGVHLFEKAEYDIVFVDYIMPGMNGIQTVSKIREMPGGSEQLVIGLTASTVPEFKNGLNELGVELILFKPVKREQMAFILYRELESKAVFDFTTDI